MESGKAGQSPTEPEKTATSAAVGSKPQLPGDAAQAGGQHLAVAQVRTGLGGGFVAGVAREDVLVVRR